jgi:hypothetical protein
MNLGGGQAAARAPLGRAQAVRIAALLGALALSALGAVLPLPGLDPAFFEMSVHTRTAARLSIFALRLWPLVQAIFVVEIARLTTPRLARWAATPAGAAGFDKAAWIVAFALAASQGAALAAAIGRIGGAVAEPGLLFEFSAAGTAVGATAILGAMGLLIRRVGAGDGLLILFAAPLLAIATRQTILAFVVGDGAEFVAIAAAAAAGLVWAAQASRRSLPGALGLGGGQIDPLPPLIAWHIAGWPALVLQATLWPHLDPTTGVAEALTAATAAAAIGLIATARAALPNAPAPRRAPWPVTGAVIAVCAGPALIHALIPAALKPNGYALVFIVAAALSVVDAFRRRTV